MQPHSVPGQPRRRHQGDWRGQIHSHQGLGCRAEAHEGLHVKAPGLRMAYVAQHAFTTW